MFSCVPSRRTGCLILGGLLLVAAASIEVRVSAGQSSPAPKTGGSPLQGVLDKPWTGDFDGMVGRRRIRILTPYSKTSYFIDKGVQRGIVYEGGLKLEADLNKKLKTTPATRIAVVF